MASQEAPSRNLTSHQAPRRDLTSQEAPSRNLTSHQAPSLDLTSQEAPSRNLTSHQAPRRDLISQEAPSRNLTSHQAPRRNLTSLDVGKADSPVDDQLERLDDSLTDDKDTPTSHSKNTQNDRYLIYYCAKTCGGWADRLKGIVIGYVLATLTDRRFGVRVTYPPCPFTQFLTPHRVQWDIGQEDIDTSRARKIFLKPNDIFDHNLHTADFNRTFRGRVVLFKARLDYFDLIKANPHYKEQLRWMQNLTRDQIFARLFHELFKLSSHVQESLKAVRPASYSTRLVCAHLRFADNSELFHDGMKRHTTAHGVTVIKFLQTFDPSHETYNVTRASAALTPSVTSADLRFFVASDSQVFTEKARKAFGDRFVATRGTVIHVDKVSKQDKQKVCESASKAVVDQQLLSTCDVLLVSMSGFSRQAAYLRGTDRGLYCILLDGTLRECSTSRLRDLYKVLG